MSKSKNYSELHAGVIQATVGKDGDLCTLIGKTLSIGTFDSLGRPENVSITTIIGIVTEAKKSPNITLKLSNGMELSCNFDGVKIVATYGKQGTSLDDTTCMVKIHSGATLNWTFCFKDGELNPQP